MKSQINRSQYRKSIKPKYKTIAGLGNVPFDLSQFQGGFPGGAGRFDKAQSFKEFKTKKFLDLNPGVRETFTGATSGDCINIKSTNGVRLLLIDNTVDHSPPMDIMALLQGRQPEKHVPKPKNLQVNLSYRFNDIDTNDALSVAKVSWELFRIVHGKRKTEGLEKIMGIEKKDDSTSLFDFIKMTSPFYFEIHNNVANINFQFPEIEKKRSEGEEKEGEEKEGEEKEGEEKEGEEKESEEMNEKRDQLYAVISKFKDNLENIEQLELPDAQYFKGFYENIQNMKAFSLEQFQEAAIIDQQLLSHVMSVDQLDEFISNKENTEKIHSNYNNHAQNINVVMSASNADIDEKRLVAILESKDKKINMPSEFSKNPFVPPMYKSLTIDLGSNCPNQKPEENEQMDTVSVTIKLPNSPDVNVETYLSEMLSIRGTNSLIDRLESEFNANFRVSSRMSEDRLSMYISFNAILSSHPDENTIKNIQELILTGIRGIQLSDIDDKRLNNLILSKIKTDDKVEIDTYSHYLKNLSMDLYNYNAGYAMYNQDQNGIFNNEEDYATAVKKILNDITYENIFFSSSSFGNKEKKVFEHDVQGLGYNVDQLTEEQENKFEQIMEVPSLHVLEHNYNINIKRENKYLDKYIEPRFYSSKNDEPLYTETILNTPSGTKVNVMFRPSVKAPDGAQSPYGDNQTGAAVLSFKSKAFSKIYNYKGSGELGRMFFREIASNILFRAYPEFEMFQEAGIQIIPLPNLVDDTISIWIMADRQHLKDVCTGITKAIFSPVNTKLVTHKALLENVKAVIERRNKPLPVEHYENIRAQTRLGFDDHFSKVSDILVQSPDIAADLFKIWNEEVNNVKCDEVNIAIHMDYRKEQMVEIGEMIGKNLPSGKNPETGEDIEINYEGIPSISDSYDPSTYFNKLRDDNKELKGTCVVETLNPALPNPFDEVIAILEQKNPTNTDIYNSSVFDSFIKAVIPQKQEKTSQMDMFRQQMDRQRAPAKNIYGLKTENRNTQLGRINGELYSSLILPFSALDIIYLEPKTKPEHEINRKVTCDDLILNFEQMIIEDLIKPVLETPDDPKVQEMNKIFNQCKSEFLDRLNEPEGVMEIYIEDVYAVQSGVFDQYDGVSEYMQDLELKDLCVWLKDRIQNILFIKVHSVYPREEAGSQVKKPEFNNFMNNDVKVYNHVQKMKSYIDYFLEHVKETKDPQFQQRLAELIKLTGASLNNAPKNFPNSTNLRETGDIKFAEYTAILKKAEEDAELEKIREGDKKHGVDTAGLYEQTIEAMKNNPEAFRLNTEGEKVKEDVDVGLEDVDVGLEDVDVGLEDVDVGFVPPSDVVDDDKFIDVGFVPSASSIPPP